MHRDTDPAAPKAGEQLRDFDGRDVHCPECERSRWANTGPKKKDDTGRAEIGAWYIRTGRRDKGEELLSQALARNPGELWHYVRAAEAYLGVPPGR